MKQYLSSLIRKHRELDEQIAKIESPQVGAKFVSNQLRELKKMRLMLKDEIARLQRGPKMVQAST